jgi:hypothetical protein
MSESTESKNEAPALSGAKLARRPLTQPLSSSQLVFLRAILLIRSSSSFDDSRR